MALSNLFSGRSGRKQSKCAMVASLVIAAEINRLPAPTMSEPPPQATVVIVTKNRKDDLRRALASTFRQAGVTFDVLVFDDASTDGTPDMVRTEFPQARLHVAEVSTGHIVHRNRGTESRAARSW